MILVTGGTGLVGAHLLYRLVENGEKIRAIYRTERKLENTKNVFSCYTKNYESVFKSIEWFKADILDVPLLSDAFKDINYVYHCAAFVSFEPNKYKLLRRTNIDGTANIVNLCISNNVKKICYVSSIATLGSAINNKSITEKTDWNPENDNNVYAITKYGAEMEVWRATQEGLNVVIVNPGVILGAGTWRYGSGSLFKKVHKGVKYYTAGTIGLVDVKDVVSIMIKLLKSDINNERFILVAENWTYKQFLQQMAQAVNTKPPKKNAKLWVLQWAWRLDWLKHKLTGKRRLLTKQLVTSLNSETNYSNVKIKKAIGFDFIPTKESITSIGSLYLRQV